MRTITPNRDKVKAALLCYCGCSSSSLAQVANRTAAYND